MATEPARLAVLGYHRVASDGPDTLRPWRIAPALFARHVAALAELGIEITTIAQWFGRPPDSRRTAVAVTFDDAMADFASHAWPALRQVGLPAEVFVPAAHAGGVAVWDARHGSPAPLMSWEIVRRLQAEGVVFGSHGLRHRNLTAIDATELDLELAASKALIEQELGTAVATIAYPYGQHNEQVRSRAARLGYRFGVTVEMGSCSATSDRLALPRLEVPGDMTADALLAQIVSLTALSINVG
jgi:peptidoglycan/xylan/chitin deacetylase (PgdA/CDA1 family)